MSISTFVGEIKKVVPPCERYSCAKRVQCAKQQLACLAFAKFVSTGMVYRPTLKRLDPALGDGKLGFGDEVLPTQELYASIHAEEDSDPVRDVEESLWDAINSRSDLELAWMGGQ